MCVCVCVCACIYIYIYIYIYMCVCVCVYEIINTVYFIQEPFKFSDKSLSYRLELVDEFPKIVPSTFGPFIGHHQGLLACIKCVCFFKKFWKFLKAYTITKYGNRVGENRVTDVFKKGERYLKR